MVLACCSHLLPELCQLLLSNSLAGLSNAGPCFQLKHTVLKRLGMHQDAADRQVWWGHLVCKAALLKCTKT